MRLAPIGAGLHVRGSAENLAHVRATFAPSMTDLASLFGVSRQASYDWQAGQAIAQENEQRLEQLARAADLVADHSLAHKVSVFRRAISGGKSFFELVKDGADPLALANTLMGTLQREMDQRKRLDQRLANRARKKVDADDVGAPHLDEQA